MSIGGNRLGKGGGLQKKKLLFFIFLVLEGKKEGINKGNTYTAIRIWRNHHMGDETALKEEERVRLCRPLGNTQARRKEVLAEPRTVKKEDLLVSSW